VCQGSQMFLESAESKREGTSAEAGVARDWWTNR
jgi:hypothetical protein